MDRRDFLKRFGLLLPAALLPIPAPDRVPQHPASVREPDVKAEQTIEQMVREAMEKERREHNDGLYKIWSDGVNAGNASAGMMMASACVSTYYGQVNPATYMGFQPEPFQYRYTYDYEKGINERQPNYYLRLMQEKQDKEKE